MSMTTALLDWIGRLIARQESEPTSGYEPYAAARPELVSMLLKPSDVLLVEGRHSGIGSTIRYLTQSTWTHAALYVGLGANLGEVDGEPLVLVEAELGMGVIASPLSKYATHNTRICRPIGLSPEDRMKVVRFAVEHIGLAYDVKNITDLCRYFLLQALTPARWQRRVIALGSGEPRRAMCSSLIAQAFESVNYPILPEVELADERSREEILHIRHHSLYTPRDFDISPFFTVVKPTIETGFDYRRMAWATDQGAQSDEKRDEPSPPSICTSGGGDCGAGDQRLSPGPTGDKVITAS